MTQSDCIVTRSCLRKLCLIVTQSYRIVTQSCRIVTQSCLRKSCLIVTQSCLRKSCLIITQSYRIVTQSCRIMTVRSCCDTSTSYHDTFTSCREMIQCASIVTCPSPSHHLASDGSSLSVCGLGGRGGSGPVLHFTRRCATLHSGCCSPAAGFFTLTVRCWVSRSAEAVAVTSFLTLHSLTSGLLQC